MAEKYLKDMAQEISSYIPGKSEISETDENVILSSEMEAGVKGISLNIEISPSTVKIKGSREYQYPISDESEKTFQTEMLKRHHGYSIYVTGQVLSCSKFFSYQDNQEAVSAIKDGIDTLKDAVKTFEEMCVDFVERNQEAKQEEEYNPEDNISLVNVDNSYHAVAMTEQDNNDYEKEHQEFTAETFNNLAQKTGCIVNGNEAIKTESDGKTIKCVLFKLDAEIMVSVSVNASRDVGAMYTSFINANYPEVMSSYNAEKEQFTVRTYANPDKYAPEETEELLKLCITAIDACVKEYKTTLEKKDSADFASDVQQILSEQTEGIAEREKAVAAREEEMASKEASMKAREEELQQQLAELQKEKNALKEEAEKEKERLKAHEAEMQEKIKAYEERNTKDILNIQQLANQVAALQNRQNAIGQSDSNEEELFRMKSKVQQLTSQKIALEKKLTEKITGKDKQIRDLSDTIHAKEMDIRKMESNIQDMVKNKVDEEMNKNAKKINALEKQVNAIGHILTPEEMIEYYEQYYEDVEIKKFHAANAEYVVYNDEALEIRIKFGDVNFVDVSREASLKDQILRKLNSKFGDIKFFSKDSRIIARAYFKKNATAEDVDDLVETLASNFTK